MYLTENQLKELEQIIFEIPTKYGIPLFQFFNKVKQENGQGETVIEPTENK
jgi:hypothetical protein